MFDRVEGSPVCFEEAVIMRHNEGGISQQRRMEAYDLMRCKVRRYCNVSFDGSRPVIGSTMLMRTGGKILQEGLSGDRDILKGMCGI